MMRELVITMETMDVVTRLKDSKKAHLAEYAAQVEAWKQAMTTYNDKMQKWSQNGGEDKSPQMPLKPQDYTKEYDDLLIRVGSHVLDHIELDEATQDKVLFNKFSWSDRFVQTSMMYSVGDQSED